MRARPEQVVPGLGDLRGHTSGLTDHGARRCMQVRQAPCHRDAVDQHQADDDVHRRPGEQHRDALPDLLLVHRVGLVLRRDLVDRRHARDVAEAAQRDSLDAVLGRAEPVGPVRGPQRRAEADEVPPHLHPGGPGHPHVAALVQGHRYQQTQRKERDADRIHHRAGTTSCATMRRARSRAQSCASSTSSTVLGSAAH
ncbi:Uncharacterised protein [Mycobacteroides abscessus subsp. abscessus]|nr:Uncharacterised protein [Mycobacteroides abscessus subsp. abscessus]